MNLLAAEPKHLPAIQRLLRESGLPTVGVEEHLDSFVVAEAIRMADGHPAMAVIGVGGMEIHGQFALLRSVVVAVGSQRMGVASAICARLEEQAARRGLTHIYLLTETAESFFKNLGYVVIGRGNAPAEIATTEEFSQLCPDSAVLMVKAC